MLLAGGDLKIVRPALQQNKPLCFNKITCVSPLPFSVDITKVDNFLQTGFDPRQRAGDFTGGKGFSTNRRLMAK
jgi:hypothetical protein